MKKRLIKRIAILIFISLLLFLVFILYCRFEYSLTNNHKTRTDLVYAEKDEYVIWCQVSSLYKNYYTYSENSDEMRFIYEIDVTHNNRSSVILNDFKLTNMDNSPLLSEYYVKTFTKDSITNENIEQVYKLKKLPIVLRDSGEYKAHCIKIFAETTKPISKIKSLKVQYDIEVGGKRYFSDNIEYKYHCHCSCDSQINIH